MHYAFILGVNHEWPEQRKTRGDIGLARCLSRHCGLSNDQQLVQVYDESATRSNILRRLEQLLDYRNNANVRQDDDADDDTLLIYIGGHGKRDAFCSFPQGNFNGKPEKEPYIKYEEIVDLLERKFHGGRVWVLVDCCHSGGFGEAVMEKYWASNQSLNAKYGCIMSVAPGDLAGEEWTITECFIRAFKGELSCTADGGAPVYYLSTKKGKHKIREHQSGDSDVSSSNSSEFTHLQPSWEQVIEFLADEMGRIKGNRLTTLFCGEGMEGGSYLQAPCSFGRSLSINTARSSANTISSFHSAIIPRDISWMASFRCETHEYSVNDEVYVKWIGNTDNNKGSRHVIGWLPGRIISIETCSKSPSVDGSSDSTQKLASIELRDVIAETSWVSKLSLNSSSIVLSGLPFGFGFDPQTCAETVTMLAKQLLYLDTSFRPWTPVQVLWTDGKIYKARTMCPTEVSWQSIDASHGKVGHGGVVGPYLPIQWKEEGSTSIVPYGWCVVDSSQMKLSIRQIQHAAKQSAKEAAKHILTPKDAMLASLASSKKRVSCDLIKSSGDLWEAYDAEDCEWLPVQKIEMDVSTIPLKALAFHMCYRDSGDFSVVFWEDDSMLSIAPNSLLRLRSRTEDDESNSESSATDEDEECSFHGDDVSEGDEVLRAVSTTLTLSTSWVNIGSLAVALAFGFVLGMKRSKRL